MKISVIGTGYVGLVTGTCFAHLGHDVICADTSQGKIEMLLNGKLPIWEQGLDTMIEECRSKNKIVFTTDIPLSIHSSDIIFLCVGTPSLMNGESDLSAVWNAISQIEKFSEGRKFLVIKSTVPIGIGDEIQNRLQQKNNSSYVIDVISNPEFLREGNAIADFLHPDRIVIGYHSDEARLVMKELYSPISAPLFFCQRKSAEMIKYASNAFLAMKISYINMVAGLCEKMSADIEQVSKGMGGDPRIGPDFLRAGIGYGGSCFPKDLSSFWSQAMDWGEDFPLLAATESINQQQPIKVLEKIAKALGGSLKGKWISLFGLAFKPMTDDIREAPSLYLSRLLLKEGAKIQAYDPFVHSFPLQEIKLFRDPYEALQDCEALIFVTEWPSFRFLNWDLVASQLKGRAIIDCRNLFSLKEMEKISSIYGFSYTSIGRPAIGVRKHEN